MSVPPIAIQPVPEGKDTKNRLHLDIFVRDAEAWVARSESLGAQRLALNEDPDDWYQVMADPEGNEFCFCLPP
ncbi:MAG: VOC family protein [Acidimicrobiia bacterium]